MFLRIISALLSTSRRHVVAPVMPAPAGLRAPRLSVEDTQPLLPVPVQQPSWGYTSLRDPWAALNSNPGPCQRAGSEFVL